MRSSLHQTIWKSAGSVQSALHHCAKILATIPKPFNGINFEDLWKLLRWTGRKIIRMCCTRSTFGQNMIFSMHVTCLILFIAIASRDGGGRSPPFSFGFGPMAHACYDLCNYLHRTIFRNFAKFRCTKCDKAAGRADAATFRQTN